MRKFALYPIAAVTLAGAFIAGIALRPVLEPAPSNAPAIQRAPAMQAPGVELPDFAGLVDRNGPAVVNITVTARARVQGIPGLDPDSPFAPFFRHFGAPQPQERIQQGQGSGFIVRADGVILTNAHVVDGATEVTVKLTDRREFSAKVLGSDPRTDVAVLKIEAEDLPVAALGDSSSVRVGQWVVAIGSPFGFENSVTSGIVSAKSRTVPGSDREAVPFIQTDVAVNPGNSGGPLFDLNGHVVGINSQIYSRSGGYQGISFAIPIETALNVQQQILETGTVRHGRLGVGVQPLTRQLAESFGLESTDGAVVTQVEKGSAAERAGLKAGDVILRVDDKHIIDTGQLVAVIANMLPGTKVELTLWREQKELKIPAELGGEETGVTAAIDDKAADGQDAGRLGLSVRPLTAQERQQSGLRGGLVVEQSAGAAADAGIQPADVILAVRQQPVNSVQELRAAVRAAGKGPLALLVQRGSATLYMTVIVG
jgi:serine protease Do